MAISNDIESSDDYFCDEKIKNIKSMSFETLNPLDQLVFNEDNPEFELWDAGTAEYCSIDTHTK